MNPRYTFTPAIVQDLMEIEAARQTVRLTVLPPQVAEQLRRQARVRSTHYQFVTIHPFYDGNGRTARALATLVLYRHGYDLGRFYSLEEVYVQDLPAYYTALQTHPHHNYYEGRADADLTGWLAYFIHSMAVVFRQVADRVQILYK